MHLVANVFMALLIRVENLFYSILSLAKLVRIGATALFGSEGTLVSRLTEKLLTSPGQRTVFGVLRVFLPTLVLKRQLIKSYDNTGTALVTRRQDVIDVLSNDVDFEVVYGPRMREITDGDNFFLGMQPSWDYTRDTSAMRLAMRTTDVAELVRPRALEVATTAVDACDGTVDLVQDVGLVVSSDLVDHYFGMPGPSKPDIIDWTTTLFWYLFVDLGADADLGERAKAIMPRFREYLDDRIASRKQNPVEVDDVLNRCLALQKAGTPGMSDRGIRNNLIGLMIGAVPTLSKASALVLEELLHRPESLRLAREAAASSDDNLLEKICLEALRFNPHQPFIYRRAIRPVVLSRGTLRQRTIPEGTMVFAASLSAAFDRLAINSPGKFDTDRSDDIYMSWGHGMHTCFGAAINRSVIPCILKPLLRQKNLRYGDGSEGIETAGTPFPAQMSLKFDAS